MIYKKLHRNQKIEQYCTHPTTCELECCGRVSRFCSTNELAFYHYIFLHIYGLYNFLGLSIQISKNNTYSTN